MSLNKRKRYFMIVLFAVISIFFASPFTASATEVEGIDDVNVQDSSPVPQPQKQKQHVDPFTIAIIGLSLGCMLTVSSIHWNRTQKKELEEQINNIDSYLANASAIDCHISGCIGDDPMMNIVKDIQDSRNKNLADLEERKKMAMENISATEIEILRIWG